MKSFERIKLVLPLVFAVILGMVLAGCSDEKGPTVPAEVHTPVEINIERNQEIRIGMLSFCPAPKVFFSITRGTFDILFGEDTVQSHYGFAGQTWHLELKDEKYLRLVDQNGKKYDVPQEYITVQLASESDEGGHILIGDNEKNMRPYRGKFEIRLENDRLLAINVVPMEDYLLGVVPAEMPPSWPEEALKAQAVAARSYAYFNFARFDYRNFDLADTVLSQAYAGIFAESEATTSAVVDTEGEVLTYEGNLVNALYHSTCGGHTASAKEIFNPKADVPYLVSVSDMSPWEYDYCKDSSLYSWERSYTLDQLHDALAKSIYTDPGETLSSITIAARTPAGWVNYIYISGERAQVATARDFRAALTKFIADDALPSSNFEIKYADGSYIFTGKGFGHGVGMCQWGAKGRAADGIGYKNILLAYYTGCEIEEIPYSGGMKFVRGEDYFLMHKRSRVKEEVEGFGQEYIPPEEMDEEETAPDETSH